MRILITDDVNKVCGLTLKDAGFEVIEKPTLSKEDLIKEIGNYDGIVVRSATILTSDILEYAKNMKIIGRAGAGLDNIDLNKAKDLGIKVVNSPEPLAIAVAEFAMGSMISLMRHITRGDKSCHIGGWNKSQCLGNTLYEKKLGIIGFGRIGKEVAIRALSFSMKIGIFDVFDTAIKSAKEMGLIIYNSIDDLIRDVDIITLHAPYSDENYHLINKSRLDLMHENTILINTARGKLIDETALIEKLKNRDIRGASLDVFEEEPLVDSELHSLDNVVLTPHIASQAAETQIDGAKIIASKFIEFFSKT